MQVKELLNIYESINKDISKLNSTIQYIPENRDYANVLQNTIFSEIEKFENLKKMILNLEVELVDDYTETKTTIPKPLDYSDPIFFPASV
jgi:hypothetical protein